MRLRNLFKDWPMESVVGLLMMLTTIFFSVVFAAVVGMLIYTLTQPAPAQPKQTVSQYVDKQGDVKRVCLVYKSGDHVDALSCDLIDDITGQPKGVE